MNNPDVLVIGGGAAGVAATCRLAAAGLTVAVADQSASLGGVLFRHAYGNRDAGDLSATLTLRWRHYEQQMSQLAPSVTLLPRHVFLGLDGSGLAMLLNHEKDSLSICRPKALLLATGAVERVRPLPGWGLEGVVTAGGLQVSIKASKAAPKGRIVVAGSGPLLLAVAAQLTNLGNPPAAIIEAGNPMLPRLDVFGVALPYLMEGAKYLATLKRAGVPWIRGATVTAVSRKEAGLEIVINRAGDRQTLFAETLALHDGLRPNNIGLPAENMDRSQGLLVVHAGDCKEILGSFGAFESGEVAAARLETCLLGNKRSPLELLGVDRQRRVQARLARIFAPRHVPLVSDLPDDTLLCRCEQKSVGDLRQFIYRESVSAREVKLNGRFSMGRCQGRFCSEWVMQMLESSGHKGQSAQALTGNRWPIRPVSIGALADFCDPDENIDDTGRQPAPSLKQNDGNKK